MLFLMVVFVVVLVVLVVILCVLMVCCLVIFSNVCVVDEWVWKVRERKFNIKVMWNIILRYIFKKNW